MLKKLLSIILMGTILAGMLLGCEKEETKISPAVTVEKEEILEEQKSIDDTIVDNKKTILNGNEWNIINRPKGDYALKFSASTIINNDGEECLRVEYSVKNISFDAYGKDPQPGLEYLKNACHVDMGDKYSFHVIDNNGNILNVCTSWTNDEVILSNPVYIGTIGNFAQTFNINNNVDMSYIKILFLATGSEFELPVN